MQPPREQPFDFYGRARIIFEIKRQDANLRGNIVRTVVDREEKNVGCRKKISLLVLENNRQ